MFPLRFLPQWNPGILMHFLKMPILANRPFYGVFGVSTPVPDGTSPDDLPDTLFVKNIQEDRIKQGVVGCQTGFSSGSVWKRRLHRVRI
jgi:hypothetical protein